MNYERYYTFDLPVEYKDLKIYPVRMVDYAMFYFLADCLTIDKNSIPDVKVIMMTYLEYLYHETRSNPEEKPYIYYLDRLFSIVFRDNEEEFRIPEKSLSRYKLDEKEKPVFFIGGSKYTSDDFDAIRKIICEQNLLELPDETIQKELRDKLEEAKRLRQKMDANKPASLEEQIVALSVMTGWTLEYVYSMTVRKFTKSIQRADNILHYKVYLSASMSGFVEFKDKSFIKHWLSDLSKGRYDDVKLDSDAVKDKINLSDKRKK